MPAPIPRGKKLLFIFCVGVGFILICYINDWLAELQKYELLRFGKIFHPIDRVEVSVINMDLKMHDFEIFFSTQGIFFLLLLTPRETGKER